MLNINILMAFKTITIKERVFRELSKAKGADESFSDFFERMVHERKPDLMRFAGAWKPMKNGEKETIRSAMKEFRLDFEGSFKERLSRRKHESA